MRVRTPKVGDLVRVPTFDGEPIEVHVDDLLSAQFSWSTVDGESGLTLYNEDWETIG